MTDNLERLAKVEGIGWATASGGPHDHWYENEAGECMATDWTGGRPKATLTDSGWKACVEWLWAAVLDGRISIFDELGISSSKTGTVVAFATPGKPTGDELIRAVLEVAGG